MIKGNLSPLSFTDVPRQSYTEAVLGIYERGRIDFLKDLFIWAYERSAARYAAVRQSLGEPDPFRLRHRIQLRDVVSAVVRGGMTRNQAVAEISRWSSEKIDPGQQRRFIETAEAELMSLHEGNFARYQVRPSEFASWRKAWTGT